MAGVDEWEQQLAVAKRASEGQMRQTRRGRWRLHAPNDFTHVRRSCAPRHAGGLHSLRLPHQPHCKASVSPRPRREITIDGAVSCGLAAGMPKEFKPTARALRASNLKQASTGPDSRLLRLNLDAQIDVLQK